MKLSAVRRQMLQRPSVLDTMHLHVRGQQPASTAAARPLLRLRCHQHYCCIGTAIAAPSSIWQPPAAAAAASAAAFLAAFGCTAVVPSGSSSLPLPQRTPHLLHRSNAVCQTTELATY